MIVSSQEYTRGLVVYNPTKSTSPKFKRMQEKIKHLAKTYNLPLTPVDTHIQRGRTQDKILKALRARDLLILVGGDGTVNVAVDALLRIEKEKRATVVATPMGTANDFSRNHSGRLTGVNGLSHLLDKGRVIDIHPLRVSVTDGQDGRQTTHIGVNNAGFNYTADFAHQLNSPAHRESRLRKFPIFGQLAQELRTVHTSTADVTTYTSYEDGSDTADILVDRTLIHAQKVAKYGHFAIRHTDNEFLDIPSDVPTRTAIITTAARMALGRENGTRTKEISFLTGMESVMGHVDGETFEIEPYSLVRADLSEESFTAYSLQK